MEAANDLNPDGLRIVLVLQGGGALGAYQAGVYQALHEHRLIPDWIVGTSIGAINAALLAGNPDEMRLTHLHEFWDLVSHDDPIDLTALSDMQRRSSAWWSALDTLWRGTPGFFTPRLCSLFAAGLPVAPEAASYYDTEPLAATLDGLIDFDYLNTPTCIRLTVNAVKVASGELVHFDNRTQAIGPEHIRASGALPPGFPPLRIGGELYWDGGLYSNTPLETVLDDPSHSNTLCFMVDLWSAAGPEPTTLNQVQTRQKDVIYASRSERHIEDHLRLHRLQHKLRELYARLPARAKSAATAEELAELGCDRIMHIVRLPYGGRDWHMAWKDINFTRGSIVWRWQQGYRDACRAIEHAGWLKTVTDETHVIVHELPPL